MCFAFTRAHRHLEMVNAGILVPLLYAVAAAAAGPSPNQIKNLVTFGDSYTDVVSPQMSLRAFRNATTHHT